MPLPALLTTGEAARVLRSDKTTITRMCQQKRLDSVKVGREWRVNTRNLCRDFDILPKDVEVALG